VQRRHPGDRHQPCWPKFSPHTTDHPRHHDDSCGRVSSMWTRSTPGRRGCFGQVVARAGGMDARSSQRCGWAHLSDPWDLYGAHVLYAATPPHRSGRHDVVQASP